jgi:hypothetical protein
MTAAFKTNAQLVTACTVAGALCGIASSQRHGAGGCAPVSPQTLPAGMPAAFFMLPSSLRTFCGLSGDATRATLLPPHTFCLVATLPIRAFERVW